MRTRAATTDAKAIRRWGLTGHRLAPSPGGPSAARAED
jgi:hypothetical protein